MITGRAIREARALVKWSVSALQVRADVPEDVILRAERADSTPGITLDQARRIQQTFERAGVAFLDRGHSGIRLRDDRT